MNYTLDEFVAKTKTFVFRFDNMKWIDLDLANKYPNYISMFNQLYDKQWYFTVIDPDPLDLTIIKGNVKLFDYQPLRKMSTTIFRFYDNDTLYKKTTQTELDRYLFKTDKNCDNAKVYELLLSLYNDDKYIQITMV